MATEVEQLYLQLELINIEEQMLKLQMLKRRRSIIYLLVHKNFKNGSVGRKIGKSNCQKLRSEWTNHSPCGPRQRDA